MNNAQKVDVDDLNVSADGDSGVVDQQFDRGLESRLTMVVNDLPLIRFGNVQPANTFLYNKWCSNSVHESQFFTCKM